MQVKKFEARSIKDALEMVKNQLGPDAIILAVRDNGNKFGLVGEGSVEITAAVSDLTLRKKQFVDGKMTNKDKELFARAPAKMQKDFIEKMVQNHLQRKVDDSGPRRATSQPYIEIQDEQTQTPVVYQRPQTQAQRPQAGPVQAVGGRNVSDMLNEVNNVALQRIRSAARDAWSAVQDTVERPPSPAPQGSSRHSPQAEAEINSLRKEINSLKRVIEDFRHVPQKMVSAHPGADAGLPYELSFMYEKLFNAGLNVENIHGILSVAQKEIPALQLKKKALIDAWVANYLLNHIQIQTNPFDSRLHLFVGGSGQGKTSTLVKMASHLLVEKRKRIAILTTDFLKVGAVEQLRIYSQILNVPFAVIRDKNDWAAVMAQLNSAEHILVDFPGLPLKDASEIELIQRLLPPADLHARIHFVAAATMKDADALELASRYQITRFEDVIFTCVDESAHHGLIYNFQKKFGTPLHSFGTGPHIPEDFEEASKERVLDLIFKLSKMKRT